MSKKNQDVWEKNEELTTQANGVNDSQESKMRVNEVLNQKIEEAKASPEVQQAINEEKDYRLRSAEGVKAKNLAIRLLQDNKKTNASIDDAINALVQATTSFASVVKQAHANVQSGEYTKCDKALAGSSTAGNFAKAKVSMLKGFIATLIKYNNLDSIQIEEKDVDLSFLEF
jgi:hypothetical protein